MNQEYISKVLAHVLHQVCVTEWVKVQEYFGEELANELDFLEKFDFEEVYERGDLKECAAYQNICIIQRVFLVGLYDIDNNAEATKTYVYLDTWFRKLFDLSTTGNKVHTWLN